MGCNVRFDAESGHSSLNLDRGGILNRELHFLSKPKSLVDYRCYGACRDSKIVMVPVHV